MQPSLSWQDGRPCSRTAYILNFPGDPSFSAMMLEIMPREDVMTHMCHGASERLTLRATPDSFAMVVRISEIFSWLISGDIGKFVGWG